MLATSLSTIAMARAKLPPFLIVVAFATTKIFDRSWAVIRTSLWAVTTDPLEMWASTWLLMMFVADLVWSVVLSDSAGRMAM